MRLSLFVALALCACQSSPDAEPPAAPKADPKAPPPLTEKAIAHATPLPAAVGEAPAILADVPADTTVVVGGAVGLDALMKAGDALLAAFPAEARKDAPPEVFDPAARAAKIGADLTTADGWRQLGIDAEAGVAMALDSTLPEGPLMYLRLADRGALIAALKKWGAPITAQGEADGVAAYQIDDQQVLVGQRGETSVVFASKTAISPEVRAKFVARLAPSPGLANDPVARRVFKDLGTGPRLWTYTTFAQVAAFAAGQGQPIPNAEFIAKRLRGLGFAAGPTTGGFRVLTDAKAAAALAQIFQPGRPTARFSRYFAPPGVFVVRLTLNLADAFDGVAALIPTEEGGARGKVMIAKNAVPVAAGVQLAELAKAFSGHVAFTTDLSAFGGPRPPFLVMLDVLDPAAADGIAATVLKRLADKDKVPTTPIEVAGHAGTQLGQGAGEVVVLRHQDVFFIGTQALIQQALSVTKPATGALAAAIDDQAFYGFVVDVAALGAQMAKQGEVDAATIAQVTKLLFSGLVDGHLPSGFYRDEDGIVAKSGQASTMVIGVLAAIAIPAFVKYTKRAKASEARLNVHRLSSAVALKVAEGGPALELLGAPRTPATKACEAKYAPDAAAWAAPGWAQIGFSIEEPHYYQYEVAVDGEAVKIRAIGDLDCDGQESVFEIAGTLTNGELALSPMQVTEELE